MQLLHPKRLSLLKNTEKNGFGDLDGSDVPTPREGVWRQGPEVVSTTISNSFYYLINSANFLMRQFPYVVLLDLFYWRKNPKKDEVKLCVYGHMSHQPGLEWATYVPSALILVSVVSLITEVAGWLSSRASVLQVDLFFSKILMY